MTFQCALCVRLVRLREGLAKGSSQSTHKSGRNLIKHNAKEQLVFLMLQAPSYCDNVFWLIQSTPLVGTIRLFAHYLCCQDPCIYVSGAAPASLFGCLTVGPLLKPMPPYFESLRSPPASSLAVRDSERRLRPKARPIGSDVTKILRPEVVSCTSQFHPQAC